MYNYFKGKITWIDKEYIVLEVSNIGYEIHVEDPNDFKQNKEYLIYIYHHKTEKEDKLFGFKTFEEKQLFKNFLQIKGYGPKTTLNLFKKHEAQNILKMKKEELLTIPKINKENIKKIGI